MFEFDLDALFSIENRVLKQSGENTHAAINDLSEDVRTKIDDIYIALSQLANKKDLTKRNPIGYIKNIE